MSTSVNFPYQFDGRGRTQHALGDYVRQLVEQVLFTSPGERVMRPDFGSGLLAMVFEPNSTALAATAQMLIQGALQQHLGQPAVGGEGEQGARHVTQLLEAKGARRRDVPKQLVRRRDITLPQRAVCLFHHLSFGQFA